ncbi:uncharacterized protein LOC114362640 [Ostrinia furnacalis]|uniref:uncharacterized protein LOC114362640 n=1 Tax=Ostrinia furnacalis TaxID=93504 RepID=UPI00104069B9|nr:uncharacterized protein LOC114362640 [Ostrinia furnacalis]
MPFILQQAIRKFRRQPTEGARANRNTLLQLQRGTTNLESSSFLMQSTAILLSAETQDRAKCRRRSRKGAVVVWKNKSTCLVQSACHRNQIIIAVKLINSKRTLLFY